MSRGLRLIAALAALASCGSDRIEASPHDRSPRLAVTAVAPESLCWTRGEPPARDGRFELTEPTVRAAALGSGGDAATLRFVYRGPTERAARLASGQLRRQLGLRLRAENGCNLVYVMWRLEPTPGLEVSLKRQRGKRTHAECGARGYTRMKPRQTGPLPPVRAGASHALQAEIVGDELTAWVDGRLVWQGRLDADARDLVGPAGLRTDNVRLEAELLAAAADPSGTHTAVPGCADSPE